MTRSLPEVLVLGINYTPELTGIAPYAAGLCRGLARSDFRVRAITAHPHYPAWRIAEGYGRWVSDEVDAGVQVRRVRHYVPAQPALPKRLLSELTFGLRQLLSRWGRPDVVVLISPALFATALNMLRVRMSRKPSVVWVQDYYSLGLAETGQGGSRMARLIRVVESWVLRSATAVVVIHDRFKEQAVSVLGVDPERVEVVRNWGHVETPQEFDLAEVRRELAWNDGEFVVLHAGNIGAKQALENVVDAARLAESSERLIRFVIMGDGSAANAVKEYANGATRIEFVPPLPARQFAAALRAADALLVNEKPGVREMAVPSKLTTYFSSGRPVIAATERGSITSSEIQASAAGLHVDAGDPEGLLAAAERLAADPQLSENLGKAGQAFRSDVLGEDNAIDMYVRLLERLASTHGRRRRRGRPQ